MKTGMMLLLTGMVILLTSSFCHGQSNTPAESQADLQALASGNAMFQSFDHRFKGVQGGITLLERYAPGKIRMSRGQLVSYDQVNYDAFNDELLVLRDSQETMVTATMVRYFVLSVNGDTAHFVRLAGPEGKMGYFQKMINGSKVGFYKKYYRELQQPDYKGAYSQGRDYAEFIARHKYFIHQKGKKLIEFKNRKTFLENFPEHEEKLETFIKQEKTDFKDEADLRKLFLYLNEI
ncbi:hypothetical protein [Chryseosolibacter histidini]|nr:hypothetical protein [Chryseosolibacter histidini]